MIYGYRDKVRSMAVSMVEHDIRYINSDFFSRDILITVNVSPCITKINIIYICICNYWNNIFLYLSVVIMIF